MCKVCSLRADNCSICNVGHTQLVDKGTHSTCECLDGHYYHSGSRACEGILYIYIYICIYLYYYLECHNYCDGGCDTGTNSLSTGCKSCKTTAISGIKIDNGYCVCKEGEGFVEITSGSIFHCRRNIKLSYAK